MNIVKSVAKAIADWQLGDLESAMMHACNALEGTAKKAYPKLSKQSNLQFTTLIRDNYSILGPMAIPGLDLEKTRYDVKLDKPKAPGGKPDAADIIYGVHRCSHNHGQDLPDGYELIPGLNGCQIDFVTGKVRLSEKVIFGLLAIVVFSPVNAHQKTTYGYFLKFNDHEFPINDWWGRASDFLEIVDNEPTPTLIIREYGEEGGTPVHKATEIYIKLYGKGQEEVD
jgi:hypothetical protein